MTSLLEILEGEQSIGMMLLKNTDANSCVMVSNTCKIFNNIAKEDVLKHYTDYKNTKIMDTFEKIATNKMFAHYKHPDNIGTYKTEEEYNEEYIELVKEINETNSNIILEKLTKEYKEYVFERLISRGNVEAMYIFMEEEYKQIIKNIFDIDVYPHDDDDELVYYSGHEDDDDEGEGDNNDF
jgi:hypothetical protein